MWDFWVILGDRRERIYNSAITEHEQALAQMRNALADNLPENREDWSPDDALFHLTGLLLDFYRRVDKPGWWAAQPGSLRTLETTSGLTTCLWMKPARAWYSMAPMISTSLKPGFDSFPALMMPAPSPAWRKPI
jgi:hypothetical protein